MKPNPDAKIFPGRPYALARRILCKTEFEHAKGLAYHDLLNALGDEIPQEFIPEDPEDAPKDKDLIRFARSRFIPKEIRSLALECSIREAAIRDWAWDLVEKYIEEKVMPYLMEKSQSPD